MKTTFFTKYADVKKITIELDREQFILIKVAVATLMEQYEKLSKVAELNESYKELKIIDESLHNLNFAEYKGGD